MIGRLYAWLATHASCCGCGCVIGPSIALVALGSTGYITWQIMT